MSLTHWVAKLREEQKGLAANGQPPLNFRPRRGAQVALLQSPILRAWRGKITQGANERKSAVKKSVTQTLQSVTYVLSQECYLCPDCAISSSIVYRHSSINRIPPCQRLRPSLLMQSASGSRSKITPHTSKLMPDFS
jgi:hypothetical protein